MPLGKIKAECRRQAYFCRVNRFWVAPPSEDSPPDWWRPTPPVRPSRSTTDMVRYHYAAQKPRSFTQQDLDILYPVVRDALAGVKDIDDKTTAQVDGELYTSIRRGLSNTPLYEICSGKRKNFRFHADWKFIEEIIHMMKKEFPTGGSTDPLREIRLSLAGMNDAKNKLKSVSERADKVIEKLARIFDPEGEGDEQ